MTKRKSQKQEIKRIAKQRIIILFDQARQIASKDQSLANRYIKLARKIAMKAQISIPGALKRQFCKHCYFYLIPGKNCRIRLQGKGKGRKVVYYCFNCKKYMRFMYKSKKKA